MQSKSGKIGELFSGQASFDISEIFNLILGDAMEALDQLHKNWHKTRYYLLGYLSLLQPKTLRHFRYKRLMEEFAGMEDSRKADILRRVNYYNKLEKPFQLPKGLNFERQIYNGKKSSAYLMDFSGWLSFFPSATLSYSYLFGDITEIPSLPTFLKSRPVVDGQQNENSVLLKLNQIRHYYMVKDKTDFNDKQSKLVWRGKSNNLERMDVLRQFFDSSLCDVGDTHLSRKHTAYAKPFLSIPEQLRFRYVLSVEGNDVATNTKWIMASNSLCFMRKPRFETWFMEGALIPDFHYVQLRDDYADLEEKIEFYNAHPEQARAIVTNANRYVQQFQNHRQELLISLLVMQKYFSLSGQLK